MTYRSALRALCLVTRTVMPKARDTRRELELEATRAVGELVASSESVRLARLEMHAQDSRQPLEGSPIEAQCECGARTYTWIGTRFAVHVVTGSGTCERWAARMRWAGVRYGWRR